MSFIIFVLTLNMKVIIPKRLRWVGHVAHMAEMRNHYKSLVEKWKDNIDSNFRKNEMGGHRPYSDC
jgi:hypothetical protein